METGIRNVGKFYTSLCGQRKPAEIINVNNTSWWWYIDCMSITARRSCRAKIVAPAFREEEDGRIQANN